MVDVLTQAVLLLTTHLGKTQPGEPKPLGPSEYGRLAQWLHEHDLEPQNLLREEPAEVLTNWHDSRIPVERIRYLVGRSAALGLAVEKWERAGLWILVRASHSYPTRLKRLLKSDAPAVLIGCGSQALLNQGGLAVVGSRDATGSELALAMDLGKRAAQSSVNVVSGGAAGVDETAMLAAVEAGGTAVGILADHLLRAATSKKFRAGLMNERLALVSPFNPEAGFDVGNAMSRNRYIYCLADAAVVAATSHGSGGTWNGAVQNLTEGWVPLWISRSIDASAGGATLIDKGARWLPDNGYSIPQLLSATLEAAPDIPPVAVAPPLTSTQPDFYTLFLERARELMHGQPVTVAQLCQRLDLHKAQVDLWLARAVAAGQLHKLSRPVRYAPAQPDARQPGLFI